MEVLNKMIIHNNDIPLAELNTDYLKKLLHSFIMKYEKKTYGNKRIYINLGNKTRNNKCHLKMCVCIIIK